MGCGYRSPAACGSSSEAGNDEEDQRNSRTPRRVAQAVAAEILEVDQPKVSALTRGRLAGFSLDRLVRFLVLLGSDVKIVVKPRASRPGQARVIVA